MSRRLGLLGGSFDPIHAGHLHVARVAQEAFRLDRVVFVPAARPPHKPGRRLAPGADRLAMVELAIAGEPTWVASDLELARDGPSYTIDTVHQLAAAVGEPPDAQVFLILGSDNLEGFLGWHRIDELLDRVQPIVVPRAGDPLPDLGRLLADRPPAWRRKLEAGLLRVDPAPGRSTDLRASFEEGRAPGPELPAPVARYVRDRGLYGGA